MSYRDKILHVSITFAEPYWVVNYKTQDGGVLGPSFYTFKEACDWIAKLPIER